MTRVLQSHIAGRWLGREPAQTLRSAVNGRAVAATHAETIAFDEAVDHARRVALPALLALDFQQRAERLKLLARHLVENKELLYAISAHTGATAAFRPGVDAGPESRLPWRWVAAAAGLA